MCDKSSGSIIKKFVIISAQELEGAWICKCFLANDTYMEDLRMLSIEEISHYAVHLCMNMCMLFPTKFASKAKPAYILALH